jgi:hypothetical protein
MAAQSNIARDGDTAPIAELIDQGCDLDLDVLPTIARRVPSLPRPLRSRGAPWLRQPAGCRAPAEVLKGNGYP